MDPTTLSVTELAARVQRGELSAESVARASLDAIAKGERFGAYLEVATESVLREARAVDAKRARGEALGPLAGVPIGIKDVLCTKGLGTACGSKILVQNGKRWAPPYDATVIAKLRAADAVVPGKCNMDEFAMGSSNENSAFFPARNPHDPSRVPGGSSGGSAASVAAKMTPASLGTDTGGSVRQPAAFTGVVGVKPTYGRVSRFGLVAFASSLDVVGPFASDVRGAARVLSVVAGHDPNDATCAERAVDDYEAACDGDVRGLRIGVPADYFAEGIQPAVETSIRAALASFERAGAKLVPIALPHTRFAVAVYYVLATAEASSNLARFDGVRFGMRAAGKDLASMYEATRGAGFGPEVQRRIVLGTYVLSHGYYDAYYLKAQKVRTLVRRDFEEAFAKVDVIAAPTAPTVAFKLGEQIDDPLTMYLNDVYTLPASLAGLPAISVPAAPAKAEGDRPALPVGLQIIAPAFEEARMFRAAAAWERLRDA